MKKCRLLHPVSSPYFSRREPTGGQPRSTRSVSAEVDRPRLQTPVNYRLLSPPSPPLSFIHPSSLLYIIEYSPHSSRSLSTPHIDCLRIPPKLLRTHIHHSRDRELKESWSPTLSSTTLRWRTGCALSRLPVRIHDPKICLYTSPPYRSLHILRVTDKPGGTIPNFKPNPDSKPPDSLNPSGTHQQTNPSITFSRP